MSREILFKAKRLSDGKWVEGYYIYHIKRTICVFGDSVKPEDEQHVIMQDGFSDWNMPRDTVHYDIDPKTLCQYTGLKDKNGNKIWENDIVCTPYLDPIFGDMINDTILKDYTWNVTFTDGCFCVENEDRIIVLRCFTNGKNVEVLGNIFDNQEILKGSRP